MFELRTPAPGILAALPDLYARNYSAPKPSRTVCPAHTGRISYTHRVDTLWAQARDAAAVPRHALVLLLRYFPALVTVLALALTARAAFLWLAMLASDFSPLAATLLFPFAPLSVMTGLIVCFWIMQPSMRFFHNTHGLGRLTKVSLLTIGGLLVPFLTVYATHGLLRDDRRTFIYDAVTVEVATSLADYNFGRATLDSGLILVGFVLSLIVLRKIIAFFKLGERAFGVATAAAYLEVLWMATAVNGITNSWTDLKEWLRTRQVIGPVWGAFDTAREWVFDNTWVVGELLAWIWTNAASLANFIIIPFSWLTLGAVVYNTSLNRAMTPAEEAPVEGPAEKGQPAPHQQPSRWSAYRRKYSKAAFTTTREMLDNAAQPVVGPFRNAWRNFRTLAVAGAVPMLMFCLVFVLASGAELGVVYLARAILKPLALDVAIVAIEPYILVVARFVYFLVALPLVVAALDRILITNQAFVDEQSTEEAAAEVEAEENADTPSTVSSAPNPDSDGSGEQKIEA